MDFKKHYQISILLWRPTHFLMYEIPYVQLKSILLPRILEAVNALPDARFYLPFFEFAISVGPGPSCEAKGGVSSRSF